MKLFKSIGKYLGPALGIGLWLFPRQGKFIRYSNHPEKYPFKDRDAMFKGVLRKITKLMKVTVHLEGLENVPENETVVFISNHQGLFDPFVTQFFKQEISFLAKKQLDSTPFVKRFGRMVEAVFLDREDLRAAVVANKKVVAMLDRNISMWITPEGTRTKNEDKSMLSFKAGALKPCFTKQVTIVPIALDDTWKVVENGYYGKNEVYYRILKPIKYEEYKDLSTEELANQLHDLINDNLQDIRANKGNL